MRSSLRTTCGSMLLAGIALCSVTAWGQDSSGQSLGDVARKERKERSSASHIAATHVANGDDDGPDEGGVWRLRLCTLTPCYELSVTLPKSPKWSQASEEPRPVFIPMSGREDDRSHSIRVYAAESTDLHYTVESFKRTFLQGWFARPGYFGQAARIVRDEHVPIERSTETVSHFTITTEALKYRGMSVVAGSPSGNYGFACVFREEDSDVGASICDAIIKSARYQELQPSYIHRVYPGYQPPPQYYPQNPDPPDDPPDDGDPE